MTEVREPYADELPELFSTAIMLDEKARVQFLDGLRGTRPALAARLEELLAADRDAGAFLERPLASPGVSAALAVGDVVEGFRVDANLASGANGSIYRATQDYPRRTVALKVLHFALPSAGAIARFRLEVRTLARLAHPGIVPLFAAGVIDPDSRALPWFAMELVDGARDIRAWGRERPIEERVRTVADACDAIHHAHLKGVIHRDLKPGNLLVDAAGRARVIDFGVATSAGSAATLATHVGSLTPEGAIVGTFAYMSPEQLEASRDVDARTDIYALGVLLYELCTGRLPFDYGRTPAQAMRAIAIGTAVDPVRAAPHERAVRGDLAAIILKAIERDPTRRYESAAEFGADLRHWLASEPVIARRPGFLERSWRTARRRPVLTTAVALAIVAAAGITTASAIGGAIAYRETMRAQRYITGLIVALEDPSVHGRGRDARMADAADAIVRGLSATRLPPDEEADGRMIAGRMYELLGLTSEAIAQYEPAYALRVKTFGTTSSQTLETLSALARSVAWQRSQRTDSAEFLRDEESRAAVSAAFQALVTSLGWDDPRTIDAAGWSIPALPSNDLRTIADTTDDARVHVATRASIQSRCLKVLASHGELFSDPADAVRLERVVRTIEAALTAGANDMASDAADLAYELTRTSLAPHGEVRAAAKRVAVPLVAVLDSERVVGFVGRARRQLALAMRELGDSDAALRLLLTNIRCADPQIPVGRQMIDASSIDASRLLADLGRMQEARGMLASAAATPELAGADRRTVGWRACMFAAYARSLREAGDTSAALEFAGRAREAYSRSDLHATAREESFTRDLEVAEHGPAPTAAP